MNKIIFTNLFFTSLLLGSTQIKQDVSLQLQWKHQFEFAGYYMAKEKGYYKKSGLNVKIKEFNRTVNIVDDVVNSKTTYGINYANLVEEKSNGKKIVLLSAMMQSSPHVLISLKSSGIKSIQDFKNRKIMINSSAKNTALFTAMLEANNISSNDLIKLKHSFDIKDLITHKTDLMSCFIGNEPYILDKQNIAYDIWNPKDYGFDFYDVILFTSLKELDEHPNRVEAFRLASLEGWKYAFNHVNETVELILKKYNTQNKTKGALIYEANVLKKLAYQGSDTLGHIDKTKIKNIYGVYNLSHLTHKKIDLDSFVYYKAVESISDTYKLDFEIIKNILIMILIILFLIIYRHLILRRANKNLQNQIQKELLENRRKDIMLYQKTKMADMGEMIGNIAHQWKQPLAILNVINATIKELNENNQLSKKELNENIDEMEINIMQMGQTVEDFLSYFNPNKNKINFSLLESIHKAIFIINHTLKKENVDITLDIDETCTIYGYKEEFMQVIVTIVMNAVQALENIQYKNIKIYSYTQENKTIIEISDNAGGIANDFLNKIFEPYFTTKHQSQGTGLGLYIAKMIIENSMNGKLSVANIENGAKFTIKLL